MSGDCPAQMVLKPAVAEALAIGERTVPISAGENHSNLNG